jgi:hypothetical protein
MDDVEIGKLLRETAQYATNPEFIEQLRQDLSTQFKGTLKTMMHYRHTLHFHNRQLAENAELTLAALPVPIEDLEHRSETPRTLNFQTQNELDTATQVLILEKTRPLSSHFNEEDDEISPLRFSANTATIRIWHQERKTQDITAYYVLLSNGKTASLIITYDTARNAATCDVYTPPDYDYTIHDGCNHEEDECFENYPDSQEYQDVWMSMQYHVALRNLEEQIKQARIADELRTDKARLSRSDEEAEPRDETREGDFAGPEV